MIEEKDYAYFSEALHSSYLFYTMEVDKLNKENKRLREALEKIKAMTYCEHKGSYLDMDCDNCLSDEKEDCVKYIAKQALGE